MNATSDYFHSRPQPSHRPMLATRLFLISAACLAPQVVVAFTPARLPSLTRPARSKFALETPASAATNGIELANLLYDSTSTAFDAWEWTAVLGAPAALVAGAVLVTLSETRQAMTPHKSDKNWVRVVKQMTRFLLMTSFALEVMSIFVSTVTGTVLLSHGAASGRAAVGYTSPLGLLHYHHEFEYLSIQIGFLQGLLNWLGAVALEVIVPKDGEGLSARRMNGFMASCLVTLVFWILAFSNHHFDFHGNYFGMLCRYATVFRQQFFGQFRPMSLLYGPGSVVSLVLGWRAFNTPPDLDND